jgi:membrane protease YdiL (CAAX protease family)
MSNADEPIDYDGGLALPTCWRCGRTSAPIDGCCPLCRARMTGDRKTVPPLPNRIAAEPTPAVIKLIVAFSVMMFASVIWGWIVHFGNHTEEQLIAGTIVLEVFDAGLTLTVLAWVGWLPLPGRQRQWTWAYWLLAAPALAVVLGCNLAYNRVLTSFIRWPEWYKFVPVFEGISVLNVLCVAVQPAIVEELFFRYIALGALRQVSGVHAAVWISAVMFAFAHIYAPLGLPWLLAAGVVFGYARVGGGLPLSIVMHFFHNLAVLWLVGEV